MAKTENISLNVAASKIDKELLHKIMEAIMNGSYDEDESLKLDANYCIYRFFPVAVELFVLLINPVFQPKCEKYAAGNKP